MAPRDGDENKPQHLAIAPAADESDDDNEDDNEDDSEEDSDEMESDDEDPVQREIRSQRLRTETAE